MTNPPPGPVEPTASADLGVIVRAAIHPAIGIARVGNSATEFFNGPEVDRPLAQAPGFYRDAAGALKRQAARFRIYGYDAQGQVVAELTAANAQIGWSVHLANLKAAWYEFQQALDIPESVSGNVSSPRRNAGVEGADRSGLAIDAGAVVIKGRDASGPGFACNGSFLGTPVYLGELRTDALGRLIVLGGRGTSASPGHVPLNNFANNDGWYDDTSDGPIGATVFVQGKAIPVDPAWVVVAPPDYAPNLKTVRTMHDLIEDVFIQSGALPEPGVSFTRDVLPIFERMSGLQWTNNGFAVAFGHGAPLDFGSPEFLKWASQPLHIPIDLYAEKRQQIANAFRNVERDGYSPTPLPWLYGDAIALHPPKTDNVNSSLSPTQLRALAQWAKGKFLGDYDPAAEPPRSLGAVPLADQPAMLDRAALAFCLADAFHPGCEITWPMRHASLYSAPYRILGADPNATQPDYGAALTPAVALAPNGPLTAQWPGGLTRWMAVPWQTDTASCLSGYVPEYDPYLPTFWPARVPNHVLDEPEYRVVVDASQPREVRLAAFQIRRSWPGVLPGANHETQVAAMVALYPYMGIAEERPGVPGDADFPPVMQVAVLPDFDPPRPGAAPAAARALHAHAPHAQSRRAPQGRGYAPSTDGTFMGRFAPRARKPQDR